MTIRIYIKGEFLDIYPYMNWVFLLNQEGELFLSRTEKLVEDEALHNYLFRQGIPAENSFNKFDRTIELNTKNFTKIVKIADKFSFSDLKFFYSNIICGSNKGLQFLSFDTNTEQVLDEVTVTDAPISSIAAKYMTVFASSLETSVTTLFGVKEGGFSRRSNIGPETSRVGVSNTNIHYYLGRSDLQLSNYTRSKPTNNDIKSAGEVDKEEINSIGETTPYDLQGLDPEFIFNSNDGIYLKMKGELVYFKNGKNEPYNFPLDIKGKLIKAHLLKGKKCLEFIEGLYLLKGNESVPLLEGECITSRGYVNSVNYQDTISVVNDNGAYLFRV